MATKLRDEVFDSNPSPIGQVNPWFNRHNHIRRQFVFTRSGGQFWFFMNHYANAMTKSMAEKFAIS